MQQLTDRQKQVLELFLSGKTYKQVAEELGISPETVNPHLKACARKLGTKRISRAMLTELHYPNHASSVSRATTRTMLQKLFAEADARSSVANPASS